MNSTEGWWTVISRCAAFLAFASIGVDLSYRLQQDRSPTNPKLGLEVCSMNSPIVLLVKVNYPVLSSDCLPLLS